MESCFSWIAQKSKRISEGFGIPADGFKLAGKETLT
jgi:hypothetical protein